MDAREISRIREYGTIVTRSADRSDDGEQRIRACRDIVQECQYAKIDGLMVDLFSASAIVKVYDALNATNQNKFRSLPIRKMALVALRLIR
jgi:hypothetical protein